jgi:L-iditol 2-dehydrogenase
MRSAYLRTPFQFEVRDVPEPEPGYGQILLRPALVGICGTDVQRASYLATEWEAFGHEAVGEVVAIGEGVVDLDVGQSVACQVRAACGFCRNCLLGQVENCTNGHLTRRLDFLSDLVAVDRRMVWPTDGISDQAAVLIEPMGMAFDINEVGEVGLGKTVVVVGPGPIGLLAVRIARIRGARRIVVVGTSADETRYELARDLGADLCLSADTTDVVTEVLAYTNGVGVDTVLNTATIRSVPDSLSMCSFGGIVVFMGAAPAAAGRPVSGEVGPGAVPIDVNWIHHNKLQLRGSWAAPNGLLPLGYDLLRDGQFPVERLVTHVFDLDQLEEAMRTVAERRDGAIKVAIRMHD